MLLVLGGGYIAFHAIVSIKSLSHPPPGILAVGVAFFSIPIKEGLYQWTIRVWILMKKMGLKKKADNAPFSPMPISFSFRA